jgi:alanine dehydrogenase
MNVGIPTETKADEYRVGLTPAGVKELVARGHRVLVQAGAGWGSDIADSDYARQGAEIAPSAEDVFADARLIVKVKEPQPDEVSMLRSDHVLFTYLHLAANRVLTEKLRASGALCIAYEAVEDKHGRLPLLTPMSEVAGKIAVQAGAVMLQRPLGGRGLLLGGVAGVSPGKVIIIGGGVVGASAARIAVGVGAQTYVFDRSLDRLRELDLIFSGRCSTVFSTSLGIEQLLSEVDLVIGAVLVRGAKAPHVLRRDQLGVMKPHAVLVDVAIDQGGCFETSRPTTHGSPTYQVDGIRHYCVANMPGATPVTSTFALVNASMPYVIKLADFGARTALLSDSGFLRGMSVASRCIVDPVLAREQGVPVTDRLPLLEALEVPS